MKSIKRQCAVCGTTIAILESTGKVGCPQCYELFGNEILSHLHKTTFNYEDDNDMDNNYFGSYQDLVIRLQEAVEHEDYEEAATIRDRLHNLKEQSL